MTIVNYPEFLQTQTYSAQRLRFQQEDFTPNGEGVMGQADFRISQRAAGANMSVDVAAGSAIVRGDTITRQGLYHVVNDAVINASISANASGNPRIDRVLVQLSDSTDSGSGTDVSVINVLSGTPTGGATLDNLSGAAAIPNNQLHLADIIVANGAATIVDANIRSRRGFAKPLVPPLVGLTDTEQVLLAPIPGVSSNAGANVQHASHNGYQVAYAAWLPKRVVGATKVRWRYVHTATANTGNFIHAIYDASGRQVAATGVTALAGAGTVSTAVAAGLTATTTFEAGLYYVLTGFATASGGATYYAGVGVTAGAANEQSGAVIAGQPGVLLRSASGGTTLPATNTILGFTDIGAQTAVAGLTAPGAPILSLSVA